MRHFLVSVAGAVLLAASAGAQTLPSPRLGPNVNITGGSISGATITNPSGVPTLLGTISPGNVIVGTSDGLGVQDSGNQLIKTGVATRDPAATDDTTQGYSVGSMWVNTATGGLFVASNVTTNAATWAKATGVSPYTSVGWTWSSVSAGATNYTAPGGIGTTQNFEALVAQGGTISNLYVVIATTPVGSNSVFTVYTGTPTGMTATAITCSIAPGARTCSDTAHTATLSPGQAWSLQVSNPGTAITGQSSSAIKVTWQ